jgi:TrmH family RNA methyltransferase
MGAIFAQRVVTATLDELAAWKRRQGCFLVGTSDAADADYRDIAYPRPVVLFMGSERQGLSEAAVALTDMVVRIPMVGHSDSLNLAVATGVMLYELFNQRQGRFPLNT